MRVAANMWSACDAASLPDTATIFGALTKSTIRNSTKSGVERWRTWKYFKSIYIYEHTQYTYAYVARMHTYGGYRYPST